MAVDPQVDRRPHEFGHVARKRRIQRVAMKLLIDAALVWQVMSYNDSFSIEGFRQTFRQPVLGNEMKLARRLRTQNAASIADDSKVRHRTLLHTTWHTPSPAPGDCRSLLRSPFTESHHTPA
jgi:hypothetical protein